MESKETLKWLSDRFGINESEIIWFNSGSCYSRIQVTTIEAANKVRESVKGETANGGMLHGMPLGSISEMKKETGEPYFDVTC